MDKATEQSRAARLGVAARHGREKLARRTRERDYGPVVTYLYSNGETDTFPKPESAMTGWFSKERALAACFGSLAKRMQRTNWQDRSRGQPIAVEFSVIIRPSGKVAYGPVRLNLEF